MTQKELLIFVSEHYSLTLTKGCVIIFIRRHLDALKVCRALPQEDTRLSILRDYLEAYIESMRTTVAEKFVELVFNLDEVSFSDWEDRKPKKVIMPCTVSPQDIYHPVSRKYRHLTLLVCVSAGSTALTPMVLTDSTIRDMIWSTGLRQDKDAMIFFKNLPYMTEKLFHEYLACIFRPYVLNLRMNHIYQEAFGILFMDSFSVHISERNLGLRGDDKIIALIFLAHTINIFQALNPVFFAAMKNNKNSRMNQPKDSTVGGQIWKLIRAYEQTATSFTIRSCFRKT
jgi:hypothetical protein